MTDIFISYAREDQDQAKILAETLERFGWSVWWDRNIPAGQPYDEVIEKALSDARCVIVLWSGVSVLSQWVRTEAQEGLDRKILIPMRIEDVRIPLSFRLIHAADLINWNGDNTISSFQDLVRDIVGLLGPPPKTQEEEGEDMYNSPPKRIALRKYLLIGGIVITLLVTSYYIFMYFPNNKNDDPLYGNEKGDSTNTTTTTFSFDSQFGDISIRFIEKLEQDGYVLTTDEPDYRIKIVSEPPGNPISTNGSVEGFYYFYNPTKVKISINGQTPFEIGVIVPKTTPKPNWQEARDEYTNNYLESINSNFNEIYNEIRKHAPKIQAPE